MGKSTPNVRITTENFLFNLVKMYISGKIYRIIENNYMEVRCTCSSFSLFSNFPTTSVLCFKNTFNWLSSVQRFFHKKRHKIFTLQLRVQTSIC